MKESLLLLFIGVIVFFTVYYFVVYRNRTKEKRLLILKKTKEKNKENNIRGKNLKEHNFDLTGKVLEKLNNEVKTNPKKIAKLLYKIIRENF